MTVEEKAKRYDEALEIAKKNYVTAQDLCEGSHIGIECFKNTLESIFPNLKESEDNRIRKELTEFLKKASEGFLDSTIQCKTFRKWHAWLEKQRDKDKLIQELGEYKVKYTQEVIEKYINSMSNKDDERLRKTAIAFLKDFAEQGYENAVECIDWLEKQGKDKVELNNFDVRPGLYKCVHRMFDGTPDGKLLFEIGNVYKCISKHDRAEFEVSYGHSVYLEDPVVRKYFIPYLPEE